MKKMQIEIFSSIGSVALLIILIAASKLSLQMPGYGFTATLLLYVLIMSIVGLKLAEMPEIKTR
ncbi:MAG: hypothetical protein Q8M95_09270 [Candidatus Methanoperedens sp.]|nr:hypothetical protein [Candidatus Methanoperedens sp.]